MFLLKLYSSLSYSQPLGPYRIHNRLLLCLSLYCRRIIGKSHLYGEADREGERGRRGLKHLTAVYKTTGTRLNVEPKAIYSQ
jgi:hypothetical protein